MTIVLLEKDLDKDNELIERLEKDLDKKDETIRYLGAKATTVNNNNTVNNVVFEGAVAFNNLILDMSKMELRHVLNGEEGIAEYLALCTVMGKNDEAHCYYATDPTRGNGVHLNKEGNWIRDSGGMVFPRVSRQIRTFGREYRKGKIDDGIDDSEMDEDGKHAMRMIRNDRSKMMEDLEFELGTRLRRM